MKKYKKILITGSSGLIGNSLCEALGGAGYSIYGMDTLKGPHTNALVDVSSEEDLSKILNSIMPDVVVHAAAVKSLMECEEDRIKSWKTNVESTAGIVAYAQINKIKIIYISSDVIFDGKTGNYKEDSLPHPINWYGTTKYHSELLVEKTTNYAICRTALVIGPMRAEDNVELQKELLSEVLNVQSILPEYVLGRLRGGKTVNLPDTIISSPTSLEFLKRALLIIVDNDLKGVFHCTGSEPISRYHFARQIAESFGLDASLVGIDEKNTLSIRPKNLGLNISKSYHRLGLRKKDWDVSATIKYLITNIKRR